LNVIAEVNTRMSVPRRERVGSESEELKIIKKKYAAMLPTVLESEAIHELDPYLTYSKVKSPWVDFGTIDDRGNATGWSVWTNENAMLCGRYPDSICIRWRGEVMTVREMIQRDGIDCMPTKAAALFSANYKEMTVLPYFDPANMMLPNEKRLKEYFYFSVVDDAEDRIRVEITKSFEPQITLSVGGKDLGFQYKEGCRHKIDQVTSHQLYAMYFSMMWQKPRFVDEDYYAANSYGMWTIDAHINQIDRVLKMIPSDVVIVAPGDGIGVVSRVRDNVVAGDLYVNSMTHKNVRKESILSTIVRGKECKESKVFLLSYITKFMTDDDWKELVNEKVIIVDSNQEIVSQLTQTLYYCGPGVVSYGVKSIVSDCWEFRKKHVNVNYTENLLTASGFDVECDSPALSYILTLAPGKRLFPLNQKMREYLLEHGVEPVNKPIGVRLVNKLEMVRDGAFFSPLGKYVTLNCPIVDLQVVHVLPYRTLLRTSIMNRKIIEQLGVTFYSEGAYYYFYYDKEEEKSFGYEYHDRCQSVKGNVRFGNVPLKPIGVMREGRSIFLYTEKKTYQFGLTREGFVATEQLDQIEDINVEILSSMLQYVPMNERQMWKKYGRQTTGWGDFKKKFKVQEMNK